MEKSSLFLSPMARKKRVHGHQEPNSYRVISQYAEGIPTSRYSDHSVKASRSSNLLGQPSAGRPDSEFRHNRPNPLNVNFLRQDVKLLNEPVCDVYTTSTAKEQHNWWPHRSSNEPHKQPNRTLDTTVREDFQYRGSGVKAPGRFSGNTRKGVAHGIVPVNSMREPDNTQRFWQEGISYEHQYNCRLDPQYPIRAKRHGAFVWDRVPEDQVDKMLQEHHIVPKQSPKQREQSRVTPDKGSANSLPVVAM